jgi:hypothetical protein
MLDTQLDSVESGIDELVAQLSKLAIRKSDVRSQGRILGYVGI